MSNGGLGMESGGEGGRCLQVVCQEQDSSSNGGGNNNDNDRTVHEDRRAIFEQRHERRITD